MIYIILEKNAYSNKENKMTKIECNVINSEYELYCYKTASFSEVKKELISNNLKAHILKPYMSVNLYYNIYKTYPTNKVTQFDSQAFEIIFSAIKNVETSFNTSFVFIPSLNKIDEDKYIKNVDKLNNQLEKNKYYISEKDFLPNHKEILYKAIQKAILEEVKAEQISIKDIEKGDKDFVSHTITNYLLLAKNYYTKDSIIEFIEKELK